jgi:hypothetical protein
MDEQTQKELLDLRNTVRFLSEEIQNIYKHGLHFDESTRIRYAEYIKNKTGDYLNHE